MHLPNSGLAVRSRIASDGRISLWLEKEVVSPPGPDEVLVRIEAAPLNPSDMILLLGPTNPTLFHTDGDVTSAMVQPDRLAAVQGRIDTALPVGNEGAGTVIAAGSEVSQLLGRVVAIRSLSGTYAEFRTVKARDCMLLPVGSQARDGASAFINPLTALGMVETMRREGHKALVHTAAASSLGQMLNRLCMRDGIDLVNIVRSAAQVTLLRNQGARHVIDSSRDDFEDQLKAAIRETGATLAFDAIGGGTMASRILSAMETVLTANMPVYSRYGSPTHKQVYIYGVLDPGPRIIEGQPGMAWGVGGWLMTWFYEEIGNADADRLRARAAAELTTTFASDYSTEISLSELIDPDHIRAFSRRATGEKYLIIPRSQATSA